MDYQTADFNNARMVGKMKYGHDLIASTNSGVSMTPFIPSKSEAERVTALSTDINSYINESTFSFVTGKMPLSDFTKFQDKLRSLKIDELTSILQTQYDRTVDKD